MKAKDKIISLKSKYGNQVINSNQALICSYLHEQLDLTKEQTEKLKNLIFSFEGLTRARRDMTEHDEIAHPLEIVQKRAELEQQYKYGQVNN